MIAYQQPAFGNKALLHTVTQSVSEGSQPEGVSPVAHAITVCYSQQPA